MEVQVELPHSLGEFRPELFGIRFALESNHDIVSKSHHDDITVRPLLTPRLDPQVEHVMKIDVGQKRRSTPALRRPFLHSYPFPIFQHAGAQPFLDQPHDACSRNASSPFCRTSSPCPLGMTNAHCQ